MIPRRHLLSTIFCLLTALALFYMLHAPYSFAQGTSGVLGKTDFGKSQNSDRDLANSLVPGKPSLTKGEKKSEVDPKTLQSKKIKDPAFEGGLNEIGVDWHGESMGKPKAASASSSADSVSAAKKEQPATTDEGSTSAKAKAEAKQEKKTKSDLPASSSQLPAAETKAADKEKSAAKTDGDH